jgi:sulfite reductase alpha subunit-like flavoprotein
MESLKNKEDDLLILYGSQTNTAKYASEELGREALRRGLQTKIEAFDEYNIFNLPTEKLVIFIVATTGDGDPPTTMINAWRFLLRKDLPPGSLSNLKFTVFGLGDSSYEKFNAMAKKLTQRLLDLGA